MSEKPLSHIKGILRNIYSRWMSLDSARKWHWLRMLPAARSAVQIMVKKTIMCPLPPRMSFWSCGYLPGIQPFWELLRLA